MFAENSLIQTVHTPTHRHVNILDLLLTSSGRFVDNINVLKDSLICKSEHFPITFDIMIKFKRNKGTKREIYNFKKGNWDRLYSELAGIGHFNPRHFNLRQFNPLTFQPPTCKYTPYKIYRYIHDHHLMSLSQDTACIKSPALVFWR